MQISAESRSWSAMLTPSLYVPVAVRSVVSVVAKFANVLPGSMPPVITLLSFALDGSIAW